MFKDFIHFTRDDGYSIHIWLGNLGIHIWREAEFLDMEWAPRPKPLGPYGDQRS